MAEERVRRRLAAILAADVVGYSRMMSADEPGTLSRLKTLRAEIFDPTTSQFGGRIFKTTGDGALAEFTSAVDAVQCAVEIQRSLEQKNADTPEGQQMALRIGISLGDVVVDGDDLYGNGVNIAARMEGLAETGGICVSGNVQEHVRNTLDVSLEDLGERSVKNIDELIRCYRVHLKPIALQSDSASTLLTKPSVAILPFSNMSGDSEQEYFSDGIAEDIITALSRARWFRVVSRNSTFAYKGTSLNVRQIAKELDARYVLEGSVRKAGNRVRITAQLIDGTTDDHIWAERYDRELEDIFDVQDEITTAIAARIEPELRRAEFNRAAILRPENLTVWDMYQRGMWHMYQKDDPDLQKALEYFRRATELDPNFGRAYGAMAQASHYLVHFKLVDDPQKYIDQAMRAAKRAVELDSEDPAARWQLGRAQLAHGNFEEAMAETEHAIRLNPLNAEPRVTLANMLMRQGRFAESKEASREAIRLCPNDNYLGIVMARLAEAHYHLHEYSDAIDWARKAARQNVAPRMWGRVTLVAALGQSGEIEEARKALQTLRKSRPEFTISFVRDQFHVQIPEALEHMIDGLRKAGMPVTVTEKEDVLPLPDKPSIAVLPFENMSGDPEQEYFADGIAEDIITALSRIRQFFVVARNTTFVYKGQSVDVQAVSRELGVRYVIEGSVRKAGNRVRISAQLIDGASGNHIWADRYDRELEDIFDLQDELTRTLVGAIQPELSKAEQGMASAKSPELLSAWDAYQRGMWHLHKMKPDDIATAESFFEQAIALDPGFGSAYSGLAEVLFMQNFYGATGSRTETGDKALIVAKKALELDNDDANAHNTLAHVHQLQRNLRLVIVEAKEAIRLNPSLASAHHNLGRALVHLGDAEEGLIHINEAIKLSPNAPNATVYIAGRAMAHLYLRQHEEAVEWAARAIRFPNAFWPVRAVLASALAHLDRKVAAKQAVDDLLLFRPGISLAFVRDTVPTDDQNYLDHFLMGLSKAGLTE